MSFVERRGAEGYRDPALFWSMLASRLSPASSMGDTLIGDEQTSGKIRAHLERPFTLVMLQLFGFVQVEKESSA